MKANEFVKKFGWGESKALVNAQSWTIRQIALSTTVDTKELARLVESHELVEKDFDSVEIAEYEYMISGCYSDTYWIRIKQAIADVGSCYD